MGNVTQSTTGSTHPTCSVAFRDTHYAMFKTFTLPKQNINKVVKDCLQQFQVYEL
jgi:hypothetical protein